jgi:hypothetical protein
LTKEDSGILISKMRKALQEREKRRKKKEAKKKEE